MEEKNITVLRACIFGALDPGAALKSEDLQAFKTFCSLYHILKIDIHNLVKKMFITFFLLDVR